MPESLSMTGLTRETMLALKPGEVIHRRRFGGGCAIWEVDEARASGALRDSSQPIAMVRTRANWPGGGIEILFSDEADRLRSWHVASECDAREEA